MTRRRPPHRDHGAPPREADPRRASRHRDAEPPRAAHSGILCALACERGQAALETVAMVPVVITAALAIGQVLAAEATRELAGHAAEAAAIAVVRGGDPEDAARAALPGWSRDRLAVEVRGRAVSVRLEPPTAVPGLAGVLATTARADAGPGTDRPSAGTGAGASETDRGDPAKAAGDAEAAGP